MVPAPNTSLVDLHHSRVKPAQVFCVASLCLLGWFGSSVFPRLTSTAPNPSPKPLLSADSLPVIRGVFRAAKDLKCLVWENYGDIKAVLSSPLLLFLGLLENGEQGLCQPGRNNGNPCSLIQCPLFLWLVSESLLMGVGSCLVKTSRQGRDCPTIVGSIYFYLLC